MLTLFDMGSYRYRSYSNPAMHMLMPIYGLALIRSTSLGAKTAQEDKRLGAYCRAPRLRKPCSRAWQEMQYRHTRSLKREIHVAN